ncbi:TolC family protein [Culturomica massiliensis]|jgi:outer membrane protein|uniref:TolC family protein n=1 Tax=Culturomica massiliensis TaxID=1841857 RepID=UPI002356DF35|nr:TolC family protein [Culturomica massiliensis]
MKNILWIGLLLCLSAGSRAQSLTLQQYRQRVLDYNQEIKQSQEAVNAAVYALKSVKTGFFPKVDITGSYSYQIENVTFMPDTDLKHDNYSAEAGLVQNIYAGSAVRKQYEAARLQEAIARLGEEYTVDNILYAADVNYWTVVANRNLYDIADRFVNIVSELFDVVGKRFTEGAISKTDVLMVQSRLKEAEVQLNTSATNYRTSLQTLNIMMGIAADTDTGLADSIQHISALPLRQEVDVALKKRPDYLMAEQDIELARVQTRLMKASYLPNLAVGIKEKWGTTLINIDGDKRFSTIAFANLNIPVFYWGKRRQDVRVSEVQEQMKELERSKLSDQISLELNNAWVNLTESLKKVAIVSSSLDIAHDNLVLNTFSYNEGKLPVIDVLSAQVTWLQAYTNVVSAYYQYKVALAEYERALSGF